MSKPSQVARMLESCIAMQTPIFVKGAVGVGKSQIAKQVADKLGMSFTDVRLSQMDPTDIKGFPSPDPVAGVMRWLPADFLPPMKIKNKPNTTKGVLFLDELPSASVAVQAASYQLILDRKVGNYELPDGWSIMAAGNRDIDRSIVNKMPAALNNRLIHVTMDTDLDDWVAHAMTVGISSELIAFLRFKSALLHNFDATQNPPAFPTPRSWFTVDKIEKTVRDASDKYALIQGTVGDGAAAEHTAFMRLIKDLPTIDEIGVAPDSTRIPKEPATLYALTTSLAMATSKTSFKNYLQYISRMEAEWQVVYIRDCMKTANEVKFTPEFTAWSLKNADVVL